MTKMTSFCLPQNVLALRAQGADEINIKMSLSYRKEEKILTSFAFLSQI